jgi:hypothetical protein
MFMLASTACDCGGEDLGFCTADDEIGRCCTLIDGSDPNIVPRSSTVAGMDYSVYLNLRFDCSCLTCASYRGSPAFCTNECLSNEDCPDGFSCEATPATANVVPKKFCVRSGATCDAPE